MDTTAKQLRELAQILVRGNEFALPNPELADELYIEAMILETRFENAQQE